MEQTTFNEQIQLIAGKAETLAGMLHTKEGTKLALVLPFIQALGYDIFNPGEVVPAYTPAGGGGQSVDYAILREETPIMVIDCREGNASLSSDSGAHFDDAFVKAGARIALETNGSAFRFYTNLENRDKIDERPFLEFDLGGDASHLDDLEKFTKNSFNIEELMTSCGTLKYTSEFKRVLNQEMVNPSDAFVEFMTNRVVLGGNGRLAPNNTEFYAGILKISLDQFINEQAHERVSSGSIHVNSGGSIGSSHKSGGRSGGDDRMVSTPEEMEAFNIIKTLLSKGVNADRIKRRPNISYMSVLLDDNNRKPLARLHFKSSARKYLGIFDTERKEHKIQITAVEDIYKYADKITEVLSSYEIEAQESAPEKPNSEKPGKAEKTEKTEKVENSISDSTTASSDSLLDIAPAEVSAAAEDLRSTSDLIDDEDDRDADFLDGADAETDDSGKAK